MRTIFIVPLLLLCLVSARAQSAHDLQFSRLPRSWDEGIPLGNGHLGALVWQKGHQLRLSLDRADVWDLRPMKGLHRREFSYQWVYGQVKARDYDIVQQYFDAPYDREPAPSKIPVGALEFPLPDNAAVTSVHLSIQDALCEVTWDNGMRLQTFVAADRPEGWFRIEHYRRGNFRPSLVTPAYQAPATGDDMNTHAGGALVQLGYAQGRIDSAKNKIIYHQPGWNGFYYDIAVQWKAVNDSVIEGVWSISAQYPHTAPAVGAAAITEKAIPGSFEKAYARHRSWWRDFWSASSVHIPDTLLEKQWYLEQYKFGSVARSDAPPVSLQAVWTADNGLLPPWKGDYHHDLNTELSYWPAYSGNHLEEAMGFIHHLEKNRSNYQRYTKQYFGKTGLAVPGVTTLDGTEMGGWIQYSLSPTVSAWLLQDFYWQWKYSGNRSFLEKHAYPWVKDVCTFLENITVMDSAGHRKLPISSSPEMNDNSLSAWFLQNTNYDLALMRFAFTVAAEMADSLHMPAAKAHYAHVLQQFPALALSADNVLQLAPGYDFPYSHRHFSHLMAIYPLGLIKWEDGPQAQEIIRNSIAYTRAKGPAAWCGYSYSWLGSLYARAKNGDSAAHALRIFAKAFCLPNSFHANGDQTRSGYSNFTYRPFTLEGNFAFASGIQEMLLQSYNGYIEVFPALPRDWRTASFRHLRAMGGVLVDAEKRDNSIRIVLTAEKGGTAKVKLPVDDMEVDAPGTSYRKENGFIVFHFERPGIAVLTGRQS